MLQNKDILIKDTRIYNNVSRETFLYKKVQKFHKKHQENA